MRIGKKKLNRLGTKPTKVVSISLDGVASDTLQELMDEGKMPNVKNYFCDKGLIIENAISVLPSTTTPAHTSLMTGHPVSSTDVPGLKWYDRLKKRFVDSKKISTGLRFSKYLKHKTIFEEEPNALVYGEFVRRGARRWVLPAYNPFLGRTSPIGTYVEGRLLERIPTKLGKYDMVHLWWYSSDQIAHHVGDEAQKQNLQAFDNYFGKMIKKIDSETTTVAIYADHGMRDVNKRKIDLVGTLGNVGYTPTKKAIQADNELVFTFDESSTTQIYAKSDSETEKIVDTLLSAELPGLNLVMYKDSDGDINVLKPKPATGRVERAKILKDRASRLKYQPITGDPLELFRTLKKCEYDQPENDGWATGDAWLARTYNEKYPNAVERISQLFESKTAGNVVLTSRKDYYFSDSVQDYSRFESYETEKEMEARIKAALKRMTHGSLERENMQTRVLARGPGIKPEVRKYGRIEDVYHILHEAVNYSQPLIHIPKLKTMGIQPPKTQEFRTITR